MVGSTPQLRADARFNRDQIAAAAVACLGTDPAASTSQIARQAGVGRVTLYGHFPTREALVEAALVRVLTDGDAVLERLDLRGDVPTALSRLIEAGWLLTVRAANVLIAAQASLPAERVQELHREPAERVEALLARGQREGTIRADLPLRWLSATLHHLMKGAASEVAQGQLQPAAATKLLVATARSVCAPPA